MGEVSYTRSEILAARQTWIDFLREPERKKAHGQLSAGGELRCCLGHACAVLDPEKTTGWVGAEGCLPDPLTDRLGMWDHTGGSVGYAKLRDQKHEFLSDLNDLTGLSPQQIGEYLATVIEGGDDTPFRPLSDYPEGSSHA